MRSLCINRVEFLVCGIDAQSSMDRYCLIDLRLAGGKEGDIPFQSFIPGRHFKHLHEKAFLGVGVASVGTLLDVFCDPLQEVFKPLADRQTVTADMIRPNTLQSDRPEYN